MKVTLGDKYGDKLKNFKALNKEEQMLSDFLAWLVRKGLAKVEDPQAVLKEFMTKK